MLVERINVPTHTYPASNADKTTARIKGTATSIAVSPEGDRRERRENPTPEEQENPASQENKAEQEEQMTASTVPGTASDAEPKTGAAADGVPAKPHIDVRV